MIIQKNIYNGGEGSKIIKDGKKFLDLSFCAGSLLLGHNSKIFKKSLKEIINKNISPLFHQFKANNFARF